MEETILNWTLFGGFITNLGIIIKILLDNRSLSSGQKDIKTQSQRLKEELADDHKIMISKQEQANQSLGTLDVRIDFIKSNIEESNRRLESLNGSEKNAQLATEYFKLFIDETQKNRLLAERQYQQLQEKVHQLENKIAQLEQEKFQLQQENERFDRKLRQRQETSQYQRRSLDYPESPSGPRL